MTFSNTAASHVSDCHSEKKNYKINILAEEETRGKGWTVKVVERAGVKLAHQVPGLKEPTVCKKGDCFIQISEG